MADIIWNLKVVILETQKAWNPTYRNWGPERPEHE